MDLLPLLAVASFLGVLVGLGLYVLMMSKQQPQQKPQQQQPAEAIAPARQVSVQQANVSTIACIAMLRKTDNALQRWALGR